MLSDRDPAETGGYKVITTLDLDAQRHGRASTSWRARSSRTTSGAEYLQGAIGVKSSGRLGWINSLRDKGIHNGALVGLDYSTGDVLAYVGSAGYYRDDLRSHKFDPKYDVAGVGYRQPGSAFKPIVYTTAFDERKMTPGHRSSWTSRRHSGEPGSEGRGRSWSAGRCAPARRSSTR